MDQAIEREVEALADLDVRALHDYWRRQFGRPPRLKSEPILRQLLAWRIQSAVYGGLDADTKKAIARSGSAIAEGKQLGIGARLTRVWKGREVEVVVEEDGFRWKDKLYPSLSAAATAIAGSRWNGPRFFGLRRTS